MPSEIKIFLSYAHEDESFKNDLHKHFAPLRDNGQVSTWHDEKILPGEDWDEVIIKNLRAANVIIMLFSPDFFDSKYIQKTELSIAVERHNKGKALAIGVIVRDSAWQHTAMSKFQVLPKNAKSIAEAPKAKRDKIYTQVVNDVMVAANAFQQSTVAEPVIEERPQGDSSKNEKRYVCEIPLPYEKTVPVDDEFFARTIPYFAKRLHIFTERSRRNIGEYRKTPNVYSLDSTRMLQQFLQLLCREINEVFFPQGGVRTHFRYLHTGKEQYLKFAAAMSGEFEKDYALSAMPSGGVCMISKAVELERIKICFGVLFCILHA
jgi:hypothetical protein